MFCPNCKVDCGDANFCHICGWDLRRHLVRQQAQKGEEQESTIAKGAVKSTQRIAGKFQNLDGSYIELGRDTVTIHRKPLFQKVTDWMIPYCEIYNVTFMPAVMFKTGGFLSIQDWYRRRRPIADFGSAQEDIASITFSSGENGAFLRIYEFLKGIADQNLESRKQNKAGIQLSQEILQLAQTKHRLDYYYTKHYPNKREAVTALRLDTGMNAEQANMAIDFAFDIFSNASYEDVEIDLEETGEAYCPICLSTSITAHKQGFNFTRGFLGSQISLATGLLLGGLGANKVQCTCMKCGHIWKPK